MDAALLLIGESPNPSPPPGRSRPGANEPRYRPPAGNESCPQPQTSEHLAAIEIMKLKHILILQNKIDLVKESQAKEQYEQILAFVQGPPGFSGVASPLPRRLPSSPPSLRMLLPTGTVAEGAPIIPISAQLKYNIEVVCEYIVKKIPVPIRDFISEPRLIGKTHISPVVTSLPRRSFILDLVCLFGQDTTREKNNLT